MRIANHVVALGAVSLSSLGFWCGFAACVDAPLPERPPVARVLTSWDPLACGDPHRVVLELEDDAGVRLSKSVPCEHASLLLDAPHFGIYRGRIYAWQQVDHAPEVRSVMDVRLTVDEPLVHWFVMTPR